MSWASATLAGLKRGDGDRVMKVGWGGDHHSMDIRVVDDFPVVIRYDLDPVPATKLTGAVETAGAERDDLGVLDLPKHGDVDRCSDAGADDGDAYGSVRIDGRAGGSKAGCARHVGHKNRPSILS
jgi:hypothetical protein